MTEQKKVLIVGGGFGGVKAAIELADQEGFEVTLLSDEEELRYYPTLYKTATGGSRANSFIPLKYIFEGTNIKLIKACASKLDRSKKKLETTNGKSYNYDILILALGVVTNYFNIPGLKEYAYGIKSQSEVTRFKDHLHKQLTDEHKPDLNYVIVGGGPTGIELAGSLSHYINYIMKNHSISGRKIHIDLVEAQERLLPMLPKSVSRQVARRLRKLGVRLYLGSRVNGETADELNVNSKPIRSHSVVWTAGVTNHPFFKDNGFVLMGRGKVGVNAFLATEPDIYVLGDNANTPYSGMAQTAIYDGEFVAKNLIRAYAGKTPLNYNPKKPITVIPVGPTWAVVEWGKMHFSGLVGHLLRESADLKGFHDFESWPKATLQYLKEFTYEDDCDICMEAEK